jgi:lysophospholipase L1-like esterase
MRIAKRLALACALVLATVGCGTQAPQATATLPAELVLAAFGDSIAAEGIESCPGCVTFVDRYGDALAAATGRSVDVRNSARPSLRVAQLLADLQANSALADAAASADAIVVAIGTSDAPWNLTDDVCDGPATGIEPVPWGDYSDECIESHVEGLRPMVDEIFQRIAESRGGSPTILRAINLYNDWIGFDPDFPPEGVERSVAYNLAWNEMLCETAAENGFECADVGQAFNGSDGRTASGDLLASDYIHPSDAGHQRIAEVLIDLGYAPLAE